MPPEVQTPPLDRSAPDSAARTSIVAAYCQEVRKLATTLADLLDVARTRPDPVAEGDRNALVALVPVLSRLADHVERATTTSAPGVPVPPSRGADAAPTASRAELKQTVTGLLDADRAREGDDYAEFLRWVRKEFEACQNLDAPSYSPASQASAPPPDARPLVPVDRLAETLQHELGQTARLTGTTDSMPMKALFQLIEGGRKTGSLHLRTPREHLKFVFDAGHVVAVASDDPPRGMRLGDILVRLGHVDDATLRSLLLRVHQTGVPLGEALARESLVTLDQLAEALELQLLEQFARMQREPHVAYGFVPATHTDHDGRLRVTPRELLLESARRDDEARRTP